MKWYYASRRRASVALRASHFLTCGILMWGIFVVLGLRTRSGVGTQARKGEATHYQERSWSGYRGPRDPMKPSPKHGSTSRSAMRIDEYFDGIYLLNLDKRPKRLALADKRMRMCDINYTRFGATDGGVMRRIWMSYARNNTYFTNPNYLACAISHLAIYKDALEKGHQRILVVEDDNRIRYDANALFSKAIDGVPPTWELLYLGFIPLTDDQSLWNYNVFQIVGDNVALARNFWGLFGYGITAAVMNETLDAYDRDFPMELDRFLPRMTVSLTIRDVMSKGCSDGPSTLDLAQWMTMHEKVIRSGIRRTGIGSNSELLNLVFRNRRREEKSNDEIGTGFDPCVPALHQDETP